MSVPVYELDDDDDDCWSCGCGMLVDHSGHCQFCGACPPWGCGMDHEEDIEDYEPWEETEYGEDYP